MNLIISDYSIERNRFVRQSGAVPDLSPLNPLINLEFGIDTFLASIEEGHHMCHTL